MERLRKSIIWAVVASEASHIFCCVLPTLFSLMGLLAGAGLIVAMPGPLVALHDILHDWEVLMVLGSGVILLVGWGLHILAARMDCHDTGCRHEPCTPNKNRAGFVLKIATLLFMVNVLVFLVVHRGMGVGPQGHDHAHDHAIVHEHTPHDHEHDHDDH